MPKRTRNGTVVRSAKRAKLSGTRKRRPVRRRYRRRYYKKRRYQKARSYRKYNLNALTTGIGTRKAYLDDYFLKFVGDEDMRLATWKNNERNIWGVTVGNALNDYAIQETGSLGNNVRYLGILGDLYSIYTVFASKITFHVHNISDYPVIFYCFPVEPDSISFYSLPVPPAPPSVKLLDSSIPPVGVDNMSVVTSLTYIKNIPGVKYVYLAPKYAGGNFKKLRLFQKTCSILDLDKEDPGLKGTYSTNIGSVTQPTKRWYWQWGVTTVQQVHSSGRTPQQNTYLASQIGSFTWANVDIGVDMFYRVKYYTKLSGRRDTPVAP